LLLKKVLDRLTSYSPKLCRFFAISFESGRNRA
jgi:hypothetical protein